MKALAGVATFTSMLNTNVYFAK